MSALFVGAGGALGAVCRYLISLIPVKTDFPIATLVTNLLGAVVIGVIVGITEKEENISKNFSLFFKTGFCGGFTTFSTFSLETFSLLEKSEYLMGGIYSVVSLVLCLVGVWLGKSLVRR